MISLELHLFLGLFFEGFREVNGMHLRHAQAGERGPADACKQTNPPPRVARRPLRHTSPTRELCQVNMETAERLKKVASTFSDEEEAGEEHETQRRCGLGFKEAALVRHVACLTHATTILTKLTTSAE